MAESCGSISCSLKIESAVEKNTNHMRKSNHKNVKLNLVRNEFREIILQVTSISVSVCYTLKNLAIHKKFMKDGKATITLKDENINLMLSDCPPNILLLFLRTLVTKVKVNESSSTPLSIKKRLLSEKRKQFLEISPINVKDMNCLNQNVSQVKQNVCCNILENTNRKSLKRSWNGENKENDYPSKQAKKITFSQAKLTVDQERVIASVTSGANVFFTGKAGTGKSFLLSRIVGALPPQRTFVTASTGVAACQIGGITLHAFAGIGSGSAPLDQCIQLASRKSIVQQWKTCRHLIIDEISMVDGEFFKKLEHVARAVRQNDKPFGGIQLIICGDFLQLPPISKEKDARFCFQTSAWNRCIQISIVLNDVKRQTDPKFIRLLREIRLGSCSPEIEEILQNTQKNVLEKNGIVATRLCTHKDDVDYTNQMYLKKLTGDAKSYQASDSDPLLSSFMDKNSPVSRLIELKKGTQIMLVKNLNVRESLVNGSRGVVVGFENTSEALPIVRFMSGATITIRFEKFIVKAAGGIHLVRKQLPLKLAWAISIHKSQGMTLDCVELSLSKVFECGQAYVALSRAKDLKGLRVLDFNKNCVRANPNVLKFYSSLRLLEHSRPVLQPIGNKVS